MTNVTKDMIEPLKLEPPAEAIIVAERAAALSPCCKSKRGVSLFHVGHGPNGERVASGSYSLVGFNGPPPGVTCDGSDACRKSCGKRCNHAEHRAIRALLTSIDWDRADEMRVELAAFELVHVKIGPAGQVVPGGGPSCITCAREILDVGIGAVWLYEGDMRALHGWVRYTAAEFWRLTCENTEVHP